MPFGLWLKSGAEGHWKLWINGDEVWSYDGDLSAHNPIQFRFGAITGAVAESWQVDFDDLEVRSHYPNHCFQVEGFPFTDIGPVYIDNVTQPDSQTIGAYTQTVTRYPQYGMVEFGGTYPDFREPNNVSFRVINDAGGKHALAIITDLLEAAGVDDYIDADSLAEAYIAVPDDIINARFEGGGTEKRGLKDIASLGMPIYDAIVEICSRMMYWLFMDSGKIKIIPYTGTPPTSPVLALTASNKWENNQTIDLTEVNSFVSAVYGWYSRNSSLFYVAGTQEVGGQGTALDYTWDSPVCCESPNVVAAKAELLLKFLSAQDIIDPVSMSLSGARLELMTDTVSLRDELLNDTAQNYRVQAKEVGLDRGGRSTNLILVRFLGET